MAGSALFAGYCMRSSHPVVVTAPTLPSNDDVRLIAELSHEVRTPLTAMLGYVELLEQANAASSPERRRQLLQMIRASGEHLLDVITDLLDSVQADAAAVHAQSVSLVELTGEVLHLLSPRIDASGVEVRLVASPRVPPQTVIDATRLRQILLNVVDNALKFTDQRQLWVEIDVEGALLRIDVRDTGLGIPEQHVARLFVSRGEAPPTSEPAVGTGLALAISARLCDTLGGKLNIQSRVGEGTTFRIELPLNGDRAAQASAMQRELIGCRVLVADHAADARHLVSAMLRRAGAEVDEAATAQEAVALALCGDYHLLLIDLYLPEWNGMAAVRELRGAGYVRPVAALTEAAGPHERQGALRNGLDAFVPRPVDAAGLIKLVRRLCPEFSSPSHLSPRAS